MRTGTEDPRTLSAVPATGHGRAAGRSNRTALALALRGLAAGGVLLSADVHLDLWATGFKDIATIGPLFMLNAVGGFVIGLAVLTWRHWFTLFLAAGFGAATLFAFYLSVTVGLFGLQETLSGAQQVSAEVAEYVAIVAAAAAFLVERVRAGTGPA